MSEHYNWNEKRPPSDLPDSSIAREFVLLSLRQDLTPQEEELQEEALLAEKGYGIKLFERFKDQVSEAHDPKYKTILIKVFPEPESEFDKAVLKHIEESPLLFNEELAGLTVQIACEPSNDQDPESDDEAFVFWITDENEAELGIYTRGSEVRAVVKEGDKEFRFKPSLSSRKYLADIAERLFKSSGTDEPLGEE